MDIHVRPERGEDVQAIREVTEAAFKLNEHSKGTEGAIIDALREADALAISLVATVGNEVVGHVAFSPVGIDGAQVGWFGLGPVSVRPDLHGQGIGSALIREGLERLKRAGAKRCVLVGDAAYYGRFGFDNDPSLVLEGVPAEYLLRLTLDGTTASGKIVFHEGFSAS